VDQEPDGNTLSAAPFYSLTVSASPTIGGSTYPSGTLFRTAGSTVTIYAYNTYGYQFVGWTGVGPGSYTGTNRTATVAMNGNITQVATFQPYLFFSLTMTAGAGGTVAPATASYPYRSSVTIQAFPDPGFGFQRWVGTGYVSYSGLANPVTVTLYGNMTQTAIFAPLRTLTMVADPGGTVSPPPGSHSVTSGHSVVIEAFPDPGYAFMGWTGTGAGSYTTWSNPATIVVNGDISETARFAPQVLVPLTMVAGPGGTVAPTSGNYYVGTILGIFATPDPGFVFGGWVGSGPGSYTGPANGQAILIGGPITETATFTIPPTWAVTMIAAPGGTVTPASGNYPNGGTLQISATPSAGYLFKSWVGSGPGSYSGTANPATITVNGAITQTGTFQSARNVTLTTSPAGLRMGVDGVDYVSPQTFFWALGSFHTIEVDSLAVVASGDRQRFTQWTDGHPTASRNILVLTVTKTLTASYTREYFLDFQDPPEGTSMPGDSWHATGVNVPIAAVPDSGWTFAQWTGTGNGSYTGPANPTTVTMNAPITQAPSFAPGATAGYELTISASATDPFVNADVPTGSVRMLYLWTACSRLGISALEADVVGDLPVLGFAPASGVMNIGTSTALLLAIPGCAATGSMLLGSLIVNDTGGSVCLGPSAANGVLGAVDCVTYGTSTPQVAGFSSSGQPPCVVSGNACASAIVAASVREPVATEPAAPEMTRALPEANAFLGARPNPFAGRTDLHFAVASASPVSLAIYDVSGRLVRRLVDQGMAAGEHMRSWDGRGADGSRAAGGVYFVRLEIGDFRQTERIVLMRSAEQ
jgi:hypothetical protein